MSDSHQLKEQMEKTNGIEYIWDVTNISSRLLGIFASMIVLTGKILKNKM